MGTIALPATALGPYGRARTSFNPLSTLSMTAPGRALTLPMRIERSSVINCDTFTTDG